MTTADLRISVKELLDEVPINIPASINDLRVEAIETKLIADARNFSGGKKNACLIAAAIMRMLRMHPERQMLKTEMADRLFQQLIKNVQNPKIREEDLPGLINEALPKLFIEFYA